MVIDENNYLVVAMNHYQNPACITVTEFEEDLKKVTYIKKLISKPEKNARLLLNHLVTFFNVFGDVAVYLLFFKVDREHWGTLATFLIFINRMPESIPQFGIRTSDLKLCNSVIDELRKI